MTHYRLSKPAPLNVLDDGENLYCDKSTIEEALADFGHQLTAAHAPDSDVVVLELDGDVMDYVIYARPDGDNNFKNSDGRPVSVVRPKN